MSVSILSLPPELVERILLFCHPCDVAKFTETCKAAYSLVYKAEDQYLWRELFLAWPFDDLRKAPQPLLARKPVTEHDWRTALQRRVEAGDLILRKDVFSGPQLLRALEALVSVVETALPLSDSPDSDESANLQWLETLLHHIAFDAAALVPTERQLYARLMTYHALSYESDVRSPILRKRLNERRRQSRCFVYDLRKYREETLWGPYRRNEKGELVADWEHVQHVVNVVALKLCELPGMALRLYCKPRSGPAATQAFSAPFAHDREPHDWAGVAGTWRRFVCFMDYRHTCPQYPMNAPRRPEFFDDDYQEAIRPVELHLKVLDPAPAEPASVTGVVNPAYPPLFFKGFSRGAHGSDAVVEGEVRLLSDGSVRWSFVTKYDGLTQWSAEAVQIGNVCSAAGIAGIWTGAFHEEGWSARPFWMWKVPAALPVGFNV
ncbi:hypothetical protein IEO21_03417 [Rhodonia placenta]|uniref:F-box domain-containing protein n=1 Tax=Rhodonia placenta TaxID=104341 RepID=A0A8H7U3I9_9APHY|nr:hypothetical protein IEO21_03417 [Postia placenta]